MTSSVPHAGAASVDAAELLAGLQQHFGFTAFRPHQEEIILAALSGRNVLGVLPTGAGKSLTFQLPALLLPGVTLVVSPLIALMEDQVHQLAERGITAAACCTGRTTREEWADLLEAAAAGRIKLLYVAPERLSTARFQDEISRIPISMLVVDEAHCVSEWGHNFRPDYRRIRAFREVLADTPVMALTATATPAVRDDIIANLGLGSTARIIGDFDRTNLLWDVREAGPSAKVRAVVALLKALKEGSAIVYAPSRAVTEKLATALRDEGLAADFYHAGRSGGDRERCQSDFQSGKVKIICATIAFGMGVHKDDVRHVIHYSMPRSLEAYYQEAGRAGRDGLDARCTLLYSRSDLRYNHQRIEEAYPDRTLLRRLQLAAVKNELRALASEMEDAQDSFALGLSALVETGYLEGNVVDGYRPGEGGDNGARALDWLDRHRRAELNRLYKVRDYGEAENCRSRVLLAYFGQRLDACQHCDRCTGDHGPAVPHRASKSKVPVLPADGWSGRNQECFEQLREWRVELARSWGVPAFQIMNDKVLREVARALPLDQEAFVAVSGLGEKKWEAFGRELVSVIELLVTE